MKKIFLFLILLLIICLVKAADQQGTIIVNIEGENIDSSNFQKSFPKIPPGSFEGYSIPSIRISGDAVIKLSSLVIIQPLNIEEGAEVPIKIRYKSEINNENLAFKINSPDFNFNDYLILGLKDKKADFEMVGKPKEKTTDGSYNLTLDVFVNKVQYFSETFPIIVKSPLRIRILRNLKKNKTPLLSILLISSILLILLGYYLKKKKKKKHKKHKN